MRFKIDENLPVEVCDLLQVAGHDAATVREEQLGGRPDPEIAAVCKFEEKVLITLDTDFANIRFYPPEEFCGIIVIRAEDQAKPTILEFLPRIISALKLEDIEHKLWIVESKHIRVRESE